MLDTSEGRSKKDDPETSPRLGRRHDVRRRRRCEPVEEQASDHHGQRDARRISLRALPHNAYDGTRKAPITRKAGLGYSDPDYDLAVDWVAARAAIKQAQRSHENAAIARRVLIVKRSSRTEHTCPGEISKSWRLVEIVDARSEFKVGISHLSRTTSEYGKIIHPCKSHVSTSMALCHWPCSLLSKSTRVVTIWKTTSVGNDLRKLQLFAPDHIRAVTAPNGSI